jgi:hypothetical protein
MSNIHSRHPDEERDEERRPDSLAKKHRRWRERNAEAAAAQRDAGAGCLALVLRYGLVTASVFLGTGGSLIFLLDRFVPHYVGGAGYSPGLLCLEIGIAIASAALGVRVARWLIKGFDRAEGRSRITWALAYVGVAGSGVLVFWGLTQVALMVP